MGRGSKCLTKTTRREFLKRAAAGAAATVATAVVAVPGEDAPTKTVDEEVSSIKASVTKRVCAICGKKEGEDGFREMVALINPFRPEKAELVWVCRHGHFDATIIDAFTGMPVMMTGPDKRPPTLVVFNKDWRRKNRV